MSGPQVYFSLPPKELFTFPPANLPGSLPPPIRERTFRAPFGISPWLFNLAMRPEVPVLFAATYILTVFALNAVNRQRNHKPWWIARQPFFKPFVVLHNVVLAVYSFATFVAMFRAFRHTWPGFDNPNGLAGIADSMCKIHGPRGLGDAATYNTTINIWESKNALIHMSPNGNPDPTDVGRLWNEGLAFWGWIFYLSKFYEVLDTFIIVAKGKRSATLQTYHHAGAMLCMWAGMRYMSPPIWMFVFINSFIHALMYTYFTLSAINVRVPKSVKRALTTMQIAQFLFGASYAALHLFVQYDIPIATPYKVLATVSSVAASATSAVASATSEVSKIVESPAAPSFGALIKKFLLRAAGEEGIAERVGIPHDNKPVSQHIEERIAQVTQHAIPAGPKYETRWRTEWTKVNCIDTSGEAFAIYLNLFYLFPLTVLFARFFYKAYMKRTTRPRGASQNAKAIAQDARTAEKQTENAVEAAGKRAEDKVRNSGAKAQETVRDLQKELREDLKKVKEGGKFQGRRVSLAVENFEQKVQNVADSIGDNGSAASTPKKSSPKKKNNKNNKQGGDDSRPSTPLKSNESANEPDVKDDLAPKVDLKPENEAASAETEKSDAPEPSDKENQPPTTPSRKQKKKKNAQLKKEQEEQSPATPDHKQEKDSEPKKEDTDADDSQSGLLSPSKDDEKPTAETEKVPAEDESAEKQDANLEATEPTRPAPEDKESRIPDDLSQSASFINYEDAMRTSQTEDEGPAKSTA